jgi:hypothetical protein
MADCFGEFGCGYFFAACEFGVGLYEPAHRVSVAHDGQGLFQPLQVLDGDQHGGRAAVDSDSYSLVVVMNAADELGQVSLHFSQRQRRHSHKFDQNIGGSQTTEGVHHVCPVLTAADPQWDGKGHAAGTKRQSRVPPAHHPASNLATSRGPACVGWAVRAQQAVRKPGMSAATSILPVMDKTAAAAERRMELMIVGHGRGA